MRRRIQFTIATTESSARKDCFFHAELRRFAHSTYVATESGESDVELRDAPNNCLPKSLA